jgi:F0F1-type ATP synthase assembly protein I
MSWRSETMTGSTRPQNTEDMSTPTIGTPATGRPPRPSPAEQDNAGWSIFSYLIAGMVVYGLLGWLLATVTHTAVLLPLGAIAGLVVAIAGVVYKYGRS